MNRKLGSIREQSMRDTKAMPHHPKKPHLLTTRTAKRLGLCAAILGALLISSAPAFAKKATIGDQAYQAFEDGHYLTALKLAKQAAAKGEAQANTLVGRIYAGGHGVPQDMKQAANWYAKAAAKNDVHALVALGHFYAKGIGVKRDAKKAADLFKRGAKKGEPQAQYNLALLYASGGGLKEDLKQTFTWMQAAAKQDLAVAQYGLGTLYALGQGTPKDPQKAAHWTGKAAKAGHPTAQLEYAIMLFKGRGVAKNQKTAFSYFKSSALKGNPIAQNRLARLYAYGISTEPDPVEAAKWHLIARGAGITDMKMDIFLANLPKDMMAKAKKRVEESKAADDLY